MLKRKYCYIILTAIIFFNGLITGYGQKPLFNHLTVEQGLSQNTILCMTQDDRGFMWFGTRYGLNRFDGYQVVVYKNMPADSNSLFSNYINTLLSDSHKTLWVGTAEGLNRYDEEKNVFCRVNITGNPTSRININAIAENKDEQLWIGTSKGLYLRKNKSSEEFIPARQLQNLESFRTSYIMRLFWDSKNNLWISTNQKLYMVSCKEGVYSEKIFTSNTDNPQSLSDSYVQSVTEDTNGKIWIGTINGLNKYDPETTEITRYSNNSWGIVNNNVRALWADKNGKLWIGTLEGVSRMNIQTGECESFTNDASNEKSLSQNSVHSIFEDKSGSIWIGTFFGGANVAHRITAPFTVWQQMEAESGLSNNVVSSIAIDNNLVYIGTEGGGLNCYNRFSKQFTVYKNQPAIPGSLNSNLVKTLFIDSSHNLWVGTHGGGLDLFNAHTRTFKHFLNKENFKHSEVVALMEDSKGRFWVGRHAGLKAFRRNNTDLIPIDYDTTLKDLNYKNISSLLEDRHGNIWIGALEGLYMLDSQSGTLHKLSVNNNQSPNINCIFEDSEGNIFLGLYNEGLAMYRPQDKHFIIYTSKNGLPHNNVLGILQDFNKELWISTSNGLSRFNPVSKVFQTYTSSDRIAGNEFNYNAFYKASDGEMFFGGIKGLTSFYPEKIERNTKASSIVFTGLKIFNTSVNVDNAQSILKKDMGFTTRLVLQANQNTFTIEFALLNFIYPDKNKYLYKLEGIHEEWTEISSPAATFTNLPPGNYTFLIKGANNDGIWSKPVAMEISILPPFWKTWYAYFFYAILFAIVLFFVIRFFYLRALLQRDKELHEMKLNFFTNVSHEIRTHLTLITAPIEMLQNENKHNNIINYHLNLINKNVNRLLNLVTELMDFRKIESNHLQLRITRNDLITFLDDIFKSFEDLSLARNIRLSFVQEELTEEIYFDSRQMEKAIFNLLSNAFKFTPDGGSIAIHIENKKEQVFIHIIDNGKGIAPQYLNKLFTNYFQITENNDQNTGYGIGLALSKTIVELHKGTLTVESNPAIDNNNGYTQFTIALLKGYAHFDEGAIEDKRLDQRSDALMKDFSAIAPSMTLEEKKQFNILLVEDNPEVRAIIRDTLSVYELIESADGEQGWQMATEQIPDLIISDVMMPGMDGFSLCHRLKTDERTSHIPIILLTAKSSQSNQVSGLSNGADIYLTKPFSTQVLELTVRNQLLSIEKMRQKFSKEFILAPQNTVINHSDEQFLNKLISLIEEHMMDGDFGVSLLSEKMAMSQSVLYKKLKAVTNMSVNDFAKTIRLKKAAQLLALKKYSVYDVSLMVGFNDRKYFSKEFRKQFGLAPSNFQEKE